MLWYPIEHQHAAISTITVLAAIADLQASLEKNLKQAFFFRHGKCDAALRQDDFEGAHSLLSRLDRAGVHFDRDMEHAERLR